MLEQYRPGITLFSAFAAIAVLFPPVVWKSTSSILDKVFSFLFTIPNYRDTRIGGTINFGQLFLEIFIVLIISILFQLNFERYDVGSSKTKFSNIFNL